MTSAPPKGAKPEEKTIRKAVAAAALGNATEWFDVAAYAYVASVIGAQFFPNASDSAQLLSVYGILAATYLFRPLGSFIFGALGDKVGRKNVLSTTILLMTVATFALGILPTYAQIGFWAPVLLILLRLVQGISTGGEYGGAATFISETAPDHRRGRYGSFLEFGTLAGFTAGAALAATLFATLSDDAMNSYGWRIPFLLALPLGGVGLYLRLKLDESPAFKELMEKEATASVAKSPVREVFAKHWRDMVLCFVIVILINVSNYTILTFMPTYITEALDLSDNTALLLLIGMQLVMMVVILPLGRLSDRVGRKPLMLTSAVGFIVLSLPAFFLILRDSVATAAIGLLILGLLLVPLLATLGATLPAIFHTRVRYVGFAVSYSISTSIFGGTAPVLNEFLIQRTGSQYIPAFYLMLVAAIALPFIMRLTETARRPLRGTEAAIGLYGDEADLVGSRR